MTDGIQAIDKGAEKWTKLLRVTTNQARKLYII